MEQAAASLATEGGAAGLYELEVGWVNLSASERKTPAQMEAIFNDETQTKFVGKADRETVAKMYLDLHKKVEKLDKAKKRLLQRMADAIVTFCGVRKSAIVYFGGTLALLCLIGSVFRSAYFFLWFLVSLWSFVSLFCLPSRKLRAFVFKTICIKRRKRSSVQPTAGGAPAAAHVGSEPVERGSMKWGPELSGLQEGSAQVKKKAPVEEKKLESTDVSRLGDVKLP